MKDENEKTEFDREIQRRFNQRPARSRSERNRVNCGLYAGHGATASARKVVRQAELDAEYTGPVKVLMKDGKWLVPPEERGSAGGGK